MSWKDGALEEAVIRNLTGSGDYKVKYGKGDKELEIPKGGEVVLTAKSF